VSPVPDGPSLGPRGGPAAVTLAADQPSQRHAARPDRHDLFGFQQACIVTLCGGAAPRGAPVREWIACHAVPPSAEAELRRRRTVSSGGRPPWTPRMGELRAPHTPRAAGRAIALCGFAARRVVGGPPVVLRRSRRRLLSGSTCRGGRRGLLCFPLPRLTAPLRNSVHFACCPPAAVSTMWTVRTTYGANPVPKIRQNGHKNAELAP
jgi:hypothetical protein